jgi:hypothetical protein
MIFIPIISNKMWRKGSVSALGAVGLGSTPGHLGSKNLFIT